MVFVSVLIVLAAVASAGLQQSLPPAGRRGPEVGKPLPPFEASDQDGRLQSFESLKGPKGLVLVFVQSADW